jgi:hypothetical protein
MMRIGHILTYDLRCITVNHENKPEESMAYQISIDNTKRALGVFRVARIYSKNCGIIN